MYFRIGPKEYDRWFSWRIVKNPNSEFKRDISGTDKRVVCAKFVDDKQFYEGYIENDPLSFLEVARGLNLSNYIHPQLSSICPGNMKGFDEVFRSILRNRNATPDMSEELFSKKDFFTTILGPYPCDKEQVMSSFLSVDITAIPIETDNTRYCFMFNLENNSPSSTSEFFQKICIISYYLSMRYSLVKTNENFIEKMIDLSKSWIKDCSLKQSIINRLCGHKKSFIEKFEKEPSREELAEEVEEKLGLGNLRLNLISDFIADQEIKSIIDLGCGRGKLAELVSCNIKYLGIDANPFAIEKAAKKAPDHKFTISNILFPRLEESRLLPDLVILCEVLEHFNKDGREQLLKIVSDLIKPEYLIITTPNFACNEPLYKLSGYRHKDHKIEFTKEQLLEEITPLLEDYTLEIRPVIFSQELQPTLVVIASHNRPDKRKINYKLYNRIQSMYDSIHQDVSNYTIISKELSVGFSDRAFLQNSKNIFYLAPTMAPCDYTSQAKDYLEHPIACFDYYKNRGITNLIGQEKYMGSRCYILLVRNEELARQVGMNKITINSRGGYQFFDDTDPKLEEIWTDFTPIFDYREEDFFILDCEIMPWNLKAKKLIKYDFIIPGECTYLSRKYGRYSPVKTSEDYLEIINFYAKDSPLEIRPFHTLASGNIKNKRFINILLLPDNIENYWRSVSYQNTIFKSVRTHTIDLYDTEQIEDSVELWKEFCEKNSGEGFVYKPEKFITEMKSGYYIQPAMKVRGKKYLQIIYGIDYLEKDYFNKLKDRGTKRKRALAIQEFELGLKILRSFLNRNHKMRMRYIAAFLGMENVHLSSIDATL